MQLVFMRLPQFAEDPRVANMKFLKMKAGNVDQTRTKKKGRSASFKATKSKTSSGINHNYLFLVCYIIFFIESQAAPVTTPTSNQSANNIVDMQGSISQNINSCESSERGVSPLTTSDKKSDDVEPQDAISEASTVRCSSPDNKANEPSDNIVKEVRNKICFKSNVN